MGHLFDAKHRESWMLLLVQREIEELQGRGVLSHVDMTGLGAVQQSQFLKGIKVMANRFPLAFKDRPLRIETDLEGWPDSNAQFGVEDGDGVITICSTGAGFRTAIHEVFHHLWSQLTPVARAWFWKNVAKNQLLLAPGQGVHLRDHLKIGRRFSFHATKNVNELFAYAATKGVVRPFKFRSHFGITGRTWNAFDLMFGPSPGPRMVLSQHLGPLRVEPKLHLESQITRLASAEHLTVHPRNEREFRRAAGDGSIYVKTLSGHVFCTSRDRTVDLTESLNLGRIVTLENVEHHFDQLALGWVVGREPKLSGVIAEAVAVSTDEVSLELSVRTLDAFILDAERAILALSAKEVEREGGRVTYHGASVTFEFAKARTMKIHEHSSWIDTFINPSSNVAVHPRIKKYDADMVRITVQGFTQRPPLTAEVISEVLANPEAEIARAARVLIPPEVQHSRLSRVLGRDIGIPRSASGGLEL